MDRSLKWRVIGLLVGILFCVGVLIPSFVPKEQRPAWYPFSKTINLGLDLQGGLHIVYSIDLDRAVEDRAHEIKRDLDQRFIDELHGLSLGISEQLPRGRDGKLVGDDGAERGEGK